MCLCCESLVMPSEHRQYARRFLRRCGMLQRTGSTARRHAQHAPFTLRTESDQTCFSWWLLVSDCSDCLFQVYHVVIHALLTCCSTGTSVRSRNESNDPYTLKPLCAARRS